MEIDREIWRMCKHLGTSVVESVDDKSLSAYICDLVCAMSGGDAGACTRTRVARRLGSIKRFRRALAALQAQPQVEQRSAEWFELRKSRLTASDAAQAMGRGKFGTRKQLVVKKAFPEAVPPMTMSAGPLYWGVMFEPIASRSYTQRNQDVVVHEFGLVPHPTIDCFGASPDGITELGIMVEFKCPFKRKIDGNIPEQYEIQMQGQMAVCGLEECDYVECDIQGLATQEEYLLNVAAHELTDHGIVLDFGKSEPRFEYSPEYATAGEAVAWAALRMRERASKDARVVHWKLRKIHIKRVGFDQRRWDEMVPQIREFWSDVEACRMDPAQQPDRKKSRLDFIEDADDNG